MISSRHSRRVRGDPLGLLKIIWTAAMSDGHMSSGGRHLNQMLEGDARMLPLPLFLVNQASSLRRACLSVAVGALTITAARQLRGLSSCLLDSGKGMTASTASMHRSPSIRHRACSITILIPSSLERSRLDCIIALAKKIIKLYYNNKELKWRKQKY